MLQRGDYISPKRHKLSIIESDVACVMLQDPICGSAHCALAPYWSKKMGKNDLVACQASPRGGMLNLHVVEMHRRVKLRGEGGDRDARLHRHLRGGLVVACPVYRENLVDWDVEHRRRRVRLINDEGGLGLQCDKKLNNCVVEGSIARVFSFLDCRKGVCYAADKWGK
ncbi:hypothetical protein MLD38_015254 [Melastoma candidum]|uniref:Uncharacterized protein n=1 Tax=Melastoma candidum TaxID=119954 RepID=A0ACB9RGN6_9MYRT|nr:hypothetical protein MLD38_015254 [Melastoma candidum]